MTEEIIAIETDNEAVAAFEWFVDGGFTEAERANLAHAFAVHRTTALAAKDEELAAVKAENERLRGLLKTTLDFAVAYADGTGTLFDEAVAETRAALSEQQP